MAYDEGQAQMFRDDLAAVEGIDEKNMFGGIVFMLNGNMLCGVHKDGGMLRVGKDNEAAALAIDGAGPMQFTDRKMGGMVDISAEGMADDAARGKLLALAMDFVGQMPSK